MSDKKKKGASTELAVQNAILIVRETPVILANPNGETVRKSAGELLPDSFKPSHLEE